MTILEEHERDTSETFSIAPHKCLLKFGGCVKILIFVKRDIILPPH
jgi:hypothetical protein